MKIRKNERNGLCHATGRAAVSTLLAAGLLFAGCAKRQIAYPDGAWVEITPAVELIAPSAVAQASTRAVADPSQAMDFWFARADESSAGEWGAYDRTALRASRTGGSGEQTLTFDPKQYYQANGLKTRMAGWYPGGASSAGSGEGYYDAGSGAVSWTIDGSQDILLAAPGEGSKSQPMPAFAFGHALVQIQFYFYAADQRAAEACGRLTSVELLSQRNKVAFALGDAKASFSGDRTAAFAVRNIVQKAPPVTKEEAMRVGEPVMFEPQLSGLVFAVETENLGRQFVVFPEYDYAAGQAFKVYVQANELGFVVGGLTVTPWEEAEGYEVSVRPPVVPDGPSIEQPETAGGTDVKYYD